MKRNPMFLLAKWKNEDEKNNWVWKACGYEVIWRIWAPTPKKKPPFLLRHWKIHRSKNSCIWIYMLMMCLSPLFVLSLSSCFLEQSLYAGFWTKLFTTDTLYDSFEFLWWAHYSPLFVHEATFCDTVVLPISYTTWQIPLLVEICG